MTKTIDEGAKWWEASGDKSWPYCELYLARKEWAKTMSLPIGHFYTPPAMNWEPTYFALDRHWEYRYARFLRKKWMRGQDDSKYRRRRYP